MMRSSLFLLLLLTAQRQDVVLSMYMSPRSQVQAHQ
jgi:hypothetical protein